MFSRFIRDPVPDMSVAFERADAGAHYLDVVCEENWHRYIDLNTLDLASLYFGLQGQLLRHVAGFVPLNRKADAVSLGFSCGFWDVLCFTPPPWVSRSFHRLTEAWKLVIEQRIAQDAVPKPRRSTADPAAASKRNHRGDSDANRFQCSA